MHWVYIIVMYFCNFIRLIYWAGCSFIHIFFHLPGKTGARNLAAWSTSTGRSTSRTWVWPRSTSWTERLGRLIFHFFTCRKLITLAISDQYFVMRATKLSLNSKKIFWELPGSYDYRWIYIYIPLSILLLESRVVRVTTVQHWGILSTHSGLCRLVIIMYWSWFKGKKLHTFFLSYI